MDTSTHDTRQPSEATSWTEPTCFIWEQEDAVHTGDITGLVKATENSHYCGLNGPNHVITLHEGTWTDVTVTTVFHGTDDDDWMAYTLTCTWADHTETAHYSIDGRA